MRQSVFANTNKANDPTINNKEIPERTGKSISCLFAFNTLKLFIVISQPLEMRSEKLIAVILSYIMIKYNRFLLGIKLPGIFLHDLTSRFFIKELFGWL